MNVLTVFSFVVRYYSLHIHFMWKCETFANSGFKELKNILEELESNYVKGLCQKHSFRDGWYFHSFRDMWYFILNCNLGSTFWDCIFGPLIRLVWRIGTKLRRVSLVAINIWKLLMLCLYSSCHSRANRWMFNR